LTALITGGYSCEEKDSPNLDSAEDTVMRGAGASPDLDAPRSGLTHDARPDGHCQQFGRDYKIPGRKKQEQTNFGALSGWVPDRRR